MKRSAKVLNGNEEINIEFWNRSEEVRKHLVFQQCQTSASLSPKGHLFLRRKRRCEQDFKTAHCTEKIRALLVFSFYLASLRVQREINGRFETKFQIDGEFKILNKTFFKNRMLCRHGMSC